MRRSHKLQKNNKTIYFGGSMSYKVIDVDTTKKACHQHVCAYLQPFPRYTSK